MKIAPLLSKINWTWEEVCIPHFIEMSIAVAILSAQRTSVSWNTLLIHSFQYQQWNFEKKSDLVLLLLFNDGKLTTFCLIVCQLSLITVDWLNIFKWFWIHLKATYWYSQTQLKNCNYLLWLGFYTHLYRVENLKNDFFS